LVFIATVRTGFSDSATPTFTEQQQASAQHH